MKKIFMTSTLLIISVFCFALKGPSIKKAFELPGKITAAIIHGDISVILTNDPSGTFYIEGQPGYVEKVKISYQKGKLIVENRANNKFFKTVLYLPAAAIKSLYVNGDGLVTSNEIINTENLVITLNGISVVNVASAKKGKIKVKVGDDYELDL